MTTPPNAPEVDVLSAMKRKMSVESPVYVAVAALLTREAALVAERDKALNALAEISNLDPSDTDQGFNEWGEAQCFSVAQKIANDALAPIECRPPTSLETAVAERDALPAEAERWKAGFISARAQLYIRDGMKVEQARIHAETDAQLAAIDAARAEAGHGRQALQ